MADGLKERLAEINRQIMWLDTLEDDVDRLEIVEKAAEELRQLHTLLEGWRRRILAVEIVDQQYAEALRFHRAQANLICATLAGDDAKGFEESLGILKRAITEKPEKMKRLQAEADAIRMEMAK